MNKRTEHPFIMYESILSTPDMLKQCLDSHIFDNVKSVAKRLHADGIDRIILTGCGTSMLIADGCRHFFANYTAIDTVSDSAFELLNYPILNLRKSDAVIGLSHTGGTKAVVDFIKQCQEKGILTIGIMEVDNSPLSQAVELAIIGPGGKDNATPKTRSFSSGLFIGLLISLCLSELEGRAVDWEKIKSIPLFVNESIQRTNIPMKELAEYWSNKDKFVLIGSGSCFTIAREGSLKLMEAANVIALGIQIEELAHGNELFLNKDYAIIALSPYNCKGLERLKLDIEGLGCLGTDISLITDSNTLLPEEFSPTPVRFFKTATLHDELLSVFSLIIPLQFLAYYSTVIRGLHPDLASAVRPEMAEAIKKFHPPGYH